MGKLADFNTLSPNFIRYAAFLASQGNPSAAANFLVTMARTLDGLDSSEETLDSLIQLEAIVQKLQIEGHEVADSATHLLESIDDFVQRLEGEASIMAKIHRLRQKYSPLYKQANKVIYDEIGSTRIMVLGTVGET